jgi:hypothetical protein
MGGQPEGHKVRSTLHRVHTALSSRFFVRRCVCVPVRRVALSGRQAVGVARGPGRGGGSGSSNGGSARTSLDLERTTRHAGRSGRAGPRPAPAARIELLNVN